MDLFSVLWICTTLLAGHIFATMILYLMHRYIFHGKLGRLPILRKLRHLHGLHHAHTHNSDLAVYIKTPWWVVVVIGSVILLAGLTVSWGLAIGASTFAVMYGFRHDQIHFSDIDTPWKRHHMHHHRHPRANFSGVYPIFDKWFRTHEEPRPAQAISS